MPNNIFHTLVMGLLFQLKGMPTPQEFEDHVVMFLKIAALMAYNGEEVIRDLERYDAKAFSRRSVGTISGGEEWAYGARPHGRSQLS